jgi:hypothetical protein
MELLSGLTVALVEGVAVFSCLPKNGKHTERLTSHEFSR